MGKLAEGAQAAGRDAGRRSTSYIEIKVSYDKDVDYAARGVRVLGSAGADARTRSPASTTRSRWRRPPTRSSTAHTSRFIVSDDPDEVVEKLAPYVEVGFNHLVFHGPGHDQERFLRGFCADVLPRVRDRFGMVEAA